VTAAIGRPDLPPDAQGTPVQPDFRQCRARQGPDEDEIAATFGAEQFGQMPELSDRYPVMAKALDLLRVAGAAKREQHARDTAGGERVRDCKRQRPTPGDQADRRDEFWRRRGHRYDR